MSIHPQSSRNLYVHSHRMENLAPKALASSMSECSRPWYAWVVGFAALVVATLMASQASGQAKFAFDSIEMHPALTDETRVKQVHAVTKQFANSGQGNTASVNGYYAFYVPAKMTAPDGIKHISELMEEATTLLGRAELSNRTNVVRTLSEYLKVGMEKVAKGNHHPAARINAILMLSRLNSRPANLVTKAPPVPRADVLPILMAIYQDENNSDGIRAAALTGIHRQTVYGFPQIPQGDRDTIRNLSTELLDGAAPSGRSEKAHAYLQRYAVDMLDVLRPADDKQLATKLISISTTPEKPDLIALYAAERLASMSKDLEGQIEKPEDLLNSWTKRVLAAYEAEVARVEGLDRPISTVLQPPKPETFLSTDASQRSPMGGSTSGRGEEDEMAGGMSEMMELGSGPDLGERDESDEMEMGLMGGFGSSMGGPVIQAEPQPPEVRVSRSKINGVLQQVHLAVTGKAAIGKPRVPAGLLAAVSDAEKKKEIEAWIEEMKPVVEELNDPMLDTRDKWLDKLKEQVEVLKEMVGEEKEGVEKAVEDDELDGDILPEEPVDPAEDLGLVDEIGG